MEVISKETRLDPAEKFALYIHVFSFLTSIFASTAEQ